MWWTSKVNGKVLRWTAVENEPEDIFQGIAQHYHDLVRSNLPPSVNVAPPAVIPPWHVSFRYFRLAQIAEDRVEAFRNTFLALESVLDHIFPSNGASLGETAWIEAALDAALSTVNLEGKFVFPGISARDYIVSTYYREHRGSLFHSKLSYGADKLKLPHLEHERSVTKLEEALVNLKFLYIKLAQRHLGLDYRPGFVLLNQGWEMLHQNMRGKFTIYLTDDPLPTSERIDDATINPRDNWVLRLRTRNAKKLERPMVMVFLGVCAGSDVPEGQVVRGLVSESEDTPMFIADFEGAELWPQGFDRFEVALGMSGLNQGVIRRAFRT